MTRHHVNSDKYLLEQAEALRAEAIKRRDAEKSIWAAELFQKLHMPDAADGCRKRAAEWARK